MLPGEFNKSVGSLPITATLQNQSANMFKQHQIGRNSARSRALRRTFCFFALQPLQAPLILVGIC